MTAPVHPPKFDGLTGTLVQAAGNSSDDEVGWRIAETPERYCVDHRASLDMHHITENIYQRATEFMCDSCLQMDGNYACKQLDLYLWCLVGGSTIGVPGDAQFGSRQVGLAPCALPRRRII